MGTKGPSPSPKQVAEQAVCHRVIAQVFHNAMRAEDVRALPMRDLRQVCAVERGGYAEVVLFVLEARVPIVGDVAADPVGLGFDDRPSGNDVAVFLSHQAVGGQAVVKRMIFDHMATRRPQPFAGVEREREGEEGVFFDKAIHAPVAFSHFEKGLWRQVEE